ncbi:HAD domain-containing protein [Streptomyces sp. NPDC020898]|uniref:HAD domain-containing protein n=1 Tax=Streptomyces sp. NPDC020898 TaxID=3365101 RepID=UPI00378B0952
MIGSTLPLLFLDVDGPLIPFGATQQQLPNGYPTYRPHRQVHGAAAANPLITRIDPAHGPRLMALPCELVWATTWMSDANECIAPWLGLPELPVVIWPESSEGPEEDEKDGLHWKTRDLLAWAAGRPFAWVDDEITDADRTWTEAHHPGQALLHCVDPRQGLTNGDFAALDHWLRTTQAQSGQAQVRGSRRRW